MTSTLASLKRLRARNGSALGSKIPVSRRQCCSARFQHGGSVALFPLWFFAPLSSVHDSRAGSFSSANVVAKRRNAKVIVLKTR